MAEEIISKYKTMSKEIIQTVIQRKKSEEIKQTKWSKIYVVGSQKKEKEWNRRNR